jgi:hypothetical protein
MLIRAIKGISKIVAGFIVPVTAVVEPDETTYRCKLKGVVSSEGNCVSWGETWDGLKQYMKGGN